MRSHNQRPRLLAGFFLALGVGGLGLWLLAPENAPASALLRTSYDSYYSWLGLAKLPSPSPVLLVYLDDRSLEQAHLDPAQPLPRRYYARLLDRLTEARARAVVLDVVFDVPHDDADDRALAEALRRNGRTILAANLEATSHQLGEATGGRITQLTLPAPEFRAAAAAIGLANVSVDTDFTVRRSFQRVTDDAEIPASLAWTAVQRVKPDRDAAGRSGQRWLRYYGRPFALPHVGFMDALDPGAVADEVFRDRVVLVGARPKKASTTQERRDEFRSPFRGWRDDDLFMPGVEVHATQVLNLLREDGLQRWPQAWERTLTLLFAAGAASLLALALWRAALAAVLVAGATLGFLGVTFNAGNYWFPWLIPLAVQLPAALAGAVLWHSVEWLRARRRLEAARRLAEAKIREQAALLDKAQDAIVVENLRGEVRYANPSAERLYGWEGGAWPAAALRQLSADDEQWRMAQATALARGEWVGEWRQRTRTGRCLVVESRWTLIRDERGQPDSLLVISTDVTERRQLEAETLRMQRMDGIGALAGGMAHDLNNALAPVLMGAQVLRNDVASEEARRILMLMETSARRGASMVRQVLLFARGRSGDQQQLDLRPVVKEMEKMVRDTFPRSISVKSYLAADLWPVRGDATQLHQVLLNLCVNARDAMMPRGGALSLAVDNAVIAEAEAAAAPGAKPGDYVSLLVSDTGAGIPPEVLPKIFEPFFTTKAEGQGTGLGLSTTSRIVLAHGGFIKVESQPGQGTSFEILLPRLKAENDAVQAAAPAAIPGGRGELILVADDERAVRELVQRILEDHGYRVVAAADGVEAVSLFQRHQQDVALVLCDTDMPEMNGRDAMAAMRASVPGLPGILMTGEGESSVGGAVLLKPMETADLLMAVHRALGGQALSPQGDPR